MTLEKRWFQVCKVVIVSCDIMLCVLLLSGAKTYVW